MWMMLTAIRCWLTTSTFNNVWTSTTTSSLSSSTLTSFRSRSNAWYVFLRTWTDFISSEPSAPCLVAATANWVVCRGETQFVEAAANQNARHKISCVFYHILLYYFFSHLSSCVRCCCQAEDETSPVFVPKTKQHDDSTSSLRISKYVCCRVYLAPRRGAKYCNDEYVSLSVCSLACIENHKAKVH